MTEESRSTNWFVTSPNSLPSDFMEQMKEDKHHMRSLYLTALGIAITSLVSTGGFVADAASTTSSVNYGSFTPIIRDAMNHFRDVNIPLMAPIMAPTEPIYSPRGNSHWPYMCAQVQSSSNTYSVSLQWVNRPAAINSPALSQPLNTGLAQVIGSYGGAEYSSHKSALRHLIQTRTGDIAPVYISPPKNAKVTNVYLGHGIEGQAYSGGQYDSIVEWHEGTWTLQVADTVTQYELPVAKQLVAYLNTYLLPETHGYFCVNLAGDGEHTSADWTYGDMIYSCSDYHSALQAVKMAVSMRGYPSGKSSPLQVPVQSRATRPIKYAPTKIEVVGQPALTPQHVVSNDPWSGKATSWVPVYYLQEELKSVGVKTTWNGNTLDVTSTPKSWEMINEAGAPQTGTPRNGEMQFSIGGNQDEFVKAPKLVANDPATKAPTTYIPVYYANLFLQQRPLMGVSWNENKWSMATQNEPMKITISSAPKKAKVGQSITVSGTALLKNGVGAPDTQLSVMGLDQPGETSNGRVAVRTLMDIFHTHPRSHQQELIL